VVNLVSLILAPIIVQYKDFTLTTGVVILLLVGVIWWAIARSKRAAEPLAEPAVSVSAAAD
jgi:hypothetical protein